MPESVTLREQQREFTSHLRNPAEATAPVDIESRRMKVYRDLIFNNIENFLSGGFPVVRRLYGKRDWRRLVRCFVREYRCHTPYFYEISQEFVQFLMQDYRPCPVDPPFLTELAHYEWLRLALNIDEQEVDQAGVDPKGDLLAGAPVLSPLVWSLKYNYPVHRITPDTEPQRFAAEDTFLVVYRNRDDKVKFLETNAATAKLLELLRENHRGQTGDELLRQLALEMKAKSVPSLVDFGARMLRRFAELDIVSGVRV
ncbi:MAG: putative DNA-binding domain-containing protein [Halieaceae bacterium]|nr:putative DNA-binding domain-containing protein [Halieaceae bacterium]